MGNNYKLLNHTFHYDLRKNGNILQHVLLILLTFFSNSVVDTNSVNAFKACVDKFWLQRSDLLILVEPETDQYRHKVFISLLTR